LNKYQKTIGIAALLVSILLATAPFALAADAGAASTFQQDMARAMGDMHIYFGNLHSHTAYSDGEGTPEQAFQWARDTAHLDFYAITDHAEYLSPAAWQDTRGRAAQFTKAGTFAALAGFEWSSGVGHVNVLNTAAYTSTGQTRTLDSLYNWMGSNGGLGQFNHPATIAGTFNEFEYSGNPSAKRMRAVETGNAGAGNNTGFFYDYFIKALDKGWKVAPTSNQDNHSLKTNSHRTAIVTRGLTPASLMDGVASRRVYSSDDPDMQVVFKSGSDWMGSSLTRAKGRYAFDVLVQDDEDIAKLELVSNGGRVVAQQVFKQTTHFKQFEWHPEVDFSSTRAYYFVKVTERDTNQEDESHRGNQVALSAPIWFSTPQHDISIKVQAANNIIAERPMYFSYKGAWAGGTTESGVTQPRKTWYLAEGATWPGFEEWICIQNPGATDADVGITYMFQRGITKKQSVHVAAHSRLTVDVNSAVGSGKDVSARIDASEPVVVERPMYFNYHGAWTGGSIASAVPGPATRWYFAEGATQPGFIEWLSLMNPDARNAKVTITYMFPGGATKAQAVTVAAHSRQTVMVNDVVGLNRDVSAVVSSDVPIIAERPMYFKYKGAWDGGSSQYGATSPGTSWYFAEGTTRHNRIDGNFDEWLSILNPGASLATVNITYMFGDGSSTTTHKSVAPHSRQTVLVNDEVGPDKDVSVHVTSNTPVVVERPTYYNYHSALPGGDVELGVRGGARTWYFAEGTNRDGFEEWLTLQNPNTTETKATVTLMLEDGTTQDFSYVLPPTSRTTITVNGLLAD